MNVLDVIVYFFEKYTRLSVTVTIIVLIIFVILFSVIIYKISKGVMNLSLWGVKFESNKAVLEIQEQFDRLNENTNLKTQMLKLLNQANITTSNWSNLPSRDFLSKVKSFYDNISKEGAMK